MQNTNKKINTLYIHYIYTIKIFLKINFSCFIPIHLKIVFAEHVQKNILSRKQFDMPLHKSYVNGD